MDVVERAKAMVLTPKTEWLKIEPESGDTAFLFTNYVAILAAIPAVCGFIGFSIIGFGPFRLGFFSGISGAIVRYLLAFVMVYVLALIVDALAPTFGGQKNQPNALKLAVYSLTPSWLAGVFLLLPGLRWLGILGLYSLYLFWLGVPVLMKAPADKAAPYTAAVVVCGIVLFFLIGAILGGLTGGY
jgi:hypothetical protein